MDISPLPCILIVDDDPELRGAFAFLFSKEYRVIEAPGGAQALEMIKDHAPTLMVLDFSMPGMNGLEVLKAARALAPALLIMMLTSAQDIETARRALSLGACEFLTKPFEPKFLRSEIRRLLARAVDGSPPLPPSEKPWRVQQA